MIIDKFHGWQERQDKKRSNLFVSFFSNFCFFRYNLVSAKLWALMNDDELTCILVLGENSVNSNNEK